MVQVGVLVGVGDVTTGAVDSLIVTVVSGLLWGPVSEDKLDEVKVSSRLDEVRKDELESVTVTVEVTTG